MGACLGVFLKTKNKKVKEISGGAAFAALTGGITEPGVYGVTLKYKRPFIICYIFTCIGGMIMSFANAQYPGIMTVSMLTLPTLAILPGGTFTLISALTGFFGTAIATYFIGFNDKMIEASEIQ
jgi:Phosphotransferase system IIC components, glucose/maltose/N-acetylglucosamine-specific